MLLLKTSAETFPRVISLQKHAFAGQPRNWEVGELVLVSKNKKGLTNGEKQIQYFMYLEMIRPADDEEICRYWPGNSGRWHFILEMKRCTRIKQPFNLNDLPKFNTARYNGVQTHAKLEIADAQIVTNWLDLDK